VSHKAGSTNCALTNPPYNVMALPYFKLVEQMDCQLRTPIVRLFEFLASAACFTATGNSADPTDLRRALIWAAIEPP
jgi:hypothetical protein